MEASGWNRRSGGLYWDPLSSTAFCLPGRTLVNTLRAGNGAAEPCCSPAPDSFQPAGQLLASRS